MAIERWRPRWGITPWTPFRELDEIERRLDEALGRQLLPRRWRHFLAEEKGWAPAIEMFEKEDKFVIKAELPGMKEEDIDISIVGDTLTIKGERKAESEVKEEDYYCCERSYGSFLRSVMLPANVNAEKIGANFEDGVLEIDLPKAAEVKPKKITISARKKKEKTSK